MTLRPLLAAVAILVAWTLLDFLLHPASAGANLRSQRKLVAPVRPDERRSHLRSDFRFDRCLCRNLQVTCQAKVPSGRSAPWGIPRSCSRCLGRVWHIHSHANTFRVGMGLVHWWMAQGSRSRCDRWSRDSQFRESIAMPRYTLATPVRVA